jgi:hypothetical protein
MQRMQTRSCARVARVRACVRACAFVCGDDNALQSDAERMPTRLCVCAHACACAGIKGTDYRIKGTDNGINGTDKRRCSMQSACRPVCACVWACARVQTMPAADSRAPEDAA